MDAPTTKAWLSRAIVVSLAVHAIVGFGGRYVLPSAPATELVDVDLAPEAPSVEALPEEKMRPEAAKPEDKPEDYVPPTTAATVPQPEPAPPPEPPVAPIDAAVADAAPLPPDAPHVDDADGSGSGSGSAVTVAVAEDGSGGGSGSGSGFGNGSGSGSGDGSGSGSGVLASGSGSGSGSDLETAAAVDGAPTTAGTAANLLGYFPRGSVIAALIRFDRLRGSEWADPAEQILRPLPDYQALFDPQHAPHLADQLDTLVISSPSPRDVTATTLVAHTHLSRAGLRDLLPAFMWSPAQGGMLGQRPSTPADARVVIAPFQGWFLLTQPDALAHLTAPAPGNMDTLEAPAKMLPPWVEGIRKIESESGDTRGPALVVTIGATAKRYKLPAIGLGVKSIVSPTRASLAAELVKQGWLMRGNLAFATEADATEFVTAIHTVQQHVADSTLLQVALRRSHALNALQGITVAQAGVRVSYATSVSVADAHALLTATAGLVSDYYPVKPP